MCMVYNANGLLNACWIFALKGETRKEEKIF
jgi:hypothetical protein